MYNVHVHVVEADPNTCTAYKNVYSESMGVQVYVGARIEFFLLQAGL